MTCGILNLPDCIIQRFTDFLLSLVNAPLLPLLDALKTFVTQPANVAAFSSLWGVMIAVLSTFYGLFMLAAGFNLIISGHSLERREQAKEWLQNTVLMILCVQASFLIYRLLAELAAGVTSGVVSMIDPSFFLITLDNPVNVGLEITLGMAYVVVLLLTLIVFSINYLLASIGVLFFPFGLFLYFIPPLRAIGRFIINFLTFILFLPFFASIVLLGTAELLKVGAFANVKILLVIGGFMLIDVLMVLLALLAIVKSVMSVLNSSLTRGILFLKGNILAAALPQKNAPRDQSRYGQRPPPYGRFAR